MWFRWLCWWGFWGWRRCGRWDEEVKSQKSKVRVPAAREGREKWSTWAWSEGDMKSQNAGHGKRNPLSLHRATRGSGFARNDRSSDWAELRAQRWASRWATAGAAAWVGIAVLARMGIARIGVIELMFLFAPLVIVPLGMELGRVGGFESGAAHGLAGMAQTLQPLGAVLAVVAVCLPPGQRAGGGAVGGGGEGGLGVAGGGWGGGVGSGCFGVGECGAGG